MIYMLKSKDLSRPLGTKAKISEEMGISVSLTNLTFISTNNDNK